MRVELYWSHSFLPDLIQPDGLVFDFGVNSGGFSRLVSSSCALVIGFEPDPIWHSKLLLPSNVLLVPKAIAVKSGTMSLHVNEQLCSSLHFADSSAQIVNVEAITLAQALAIEPERRIDLIKMDIEGEEVSVLREAPPELFARVKQMTVEFHDFLDPKSVPAIRAVIARMEEVGFYTVRFSWNSYGDILFINQNLVSLNICQRLWIRMRYKYLRGLARIIGRLLNKIK